MSNKKTTPERLAAFSDAVFVLDVKPPAEGTLKATAVSFWSPLSGLALVCCVLLIYLSPRLPDLLHRVR